MTQRKTFTSTEVKNRYNAKSYRRITVNFRVDTDADILSILDKAAEQGISPAQFIKDAIRKAPGE